MSDRPQHPHPSATRRLPLVAGPSSVGHADVPQQAAMPDLNALRVAFHAELAALFDAARAEGTMVGQAEGRATAEARAATEQLRREEAHAESLRVLDQERAALIVLTHALRAAAERDAREVEALAIEVSFAALTRLLGQAALDGELLPRLVDQSLALLDQQRPRAVRVAPSDHARLIQAGADAVPFIADPGLLPGSCVIDTTRGELDASIEVQLQALKRVLLETHARREAGDARDSSR